MPDENQHNAALDRPSANCGDPLPPDERLCPHCGAAAPSGFPLVSAGLELLRFLLVAAIAVIAVALGALGACGVFMGVSSQNLLWFAAGAGGLVLAAGGVWVITRIVIHNSEKEGEQR